MTDDRVTALTKATCKKAVSILSDGWGAIEEARSRKQISQVVEASIRAAYMSGRADGMMDTVINEAANLETQLSPSDLVRKRTP